MFRSLDADNLLSIEACLRFVDICDFSVEDDIINEKYITKQTIIALEKVNFGIN